MWTQRVARTSQNSMVSCFQLFLVVVIVIIVANTKTPTMHSGYIPDDHGLRSRCFMLMTLMSTLHNLSRSVGYALLAASGGISMMLSFAGGEILLFLAWKILREDFFYWFRVDGFLGILGSFLIRVLVKVIADFSGCLHFR